MGIRTSATQDVQSTSGASNFHDAYEKSSLNMPR